RLSSVAPVSSFTVPVTVLLLGVPVVNFSSVDVQQLQPSVVLVELEVLVEVDVLVDVEVVREVLVLVDVLVEVVREVLVLVEVLVVVPAAVLDVLVVVVGGGGVVVVVLPAGTQPPCSHASQQLGNSPTQALPPRGALHELALRLMLHVVLPAASVRQHVTAPALPQVDCAAQPTT